MGLPPFLVHEGKEGRKTDTPMTGGNVQLYRLSLVCQGISLPEFPKIWLIKEGTNVWMTKEGQIFGVVM